MSRHAVDSSVVVAALLNWHEHHEPACEWISTRLQDRDSLVVPLQVLIESYSVMTRLPRGQALAPEVARDLLRGTFAEKVELTVFMAGKGFELLDTMVDRRISGGKAWDALIATSARYAGATHIATLNPRHFDAFSGEMEIVVPG